MVLRKIKKYLPWHLGESLSLIWRRTVLQQKKRYLYLKMRDKHQELLKQIRKKDRIRVVFLVIHKSVWKVDPVFQKILTDPFLIPPFLFAHAMRLQNVSHRYPVLGLLQNPNDLDSCKSCIHIDSPVANTVTNNIGSNFLNVWI